MLKKIKYVLAFSLLLGGWRGHVVDVIDGQKIKVQDCGVEKEIVLWGINAPVMAEPLGVDAHKGLEEMVLDKDVDVEEIPSSTSIIWAKIYCDDKLVNSELVAQGMVTVTRGITGTENLLKLELSAKIKRAGIWSKLNLERSNSDPKTPNSPCNSPISPRNLASPRGGTAATNLILEERRSMEDLKEELALVSPRTLSTRTRSGSRLGTETKKSQEDLKL